MSENGEKFTKNLSYLYGEDFIKDGKKFKRKFTIKGFKDDEFVDFKGVKTKTCSLIFEEEPKMFGLIGISVTRQLHEAIGSDLKSDAIGKKIILYPVVSTKSATGWAVRIGKAEQ